MAPLKRGRDGAASKLKTIMPHPRYERFVRKAVEARFVEACKGNGRRFANEHGFDFPNEYPRVTDVIEDPTLE